MSTPAKSTHARSYLLLALLTAANNVSLPARADSESESIIGMRATWAPPLMRAAMKGKTSAGSTTRPILSRAGNQTVGSAARPLTGGVSIGMPKASVMAPAPTFTLGTSDSIPGALSTMQPTVGKTLMLQGGVQETVPKTPEEVANYFIKMKRIINQYDQVAVAALLNSSGGLNTDPDSINSARVETLTLVNRIRSIVPPAELKQTHETLATSMAHVGDFMANGTQAGLMALPRALGLISELKTSMDTYHTGVMECINNYHLELSYDPFSGENAETKAQLNAGLSTFQQQKINELQSAPKPQPSFGADMIFGSGGSSFGSSGIGSDTPSAGLGNLFGSGAGAGAGAGDAGAALNALGGLLGGSGQGGLGGLGSLLGGKSGAPSQSGGLSSPLGSDTTDDGGSAPGALQGGTDGNAPAGMPDLGGLLGGTGGGGADPGALLKGLTGGNGGTNVIEQFGNLMKQLGGQ